MISSTAINAVNLCVLLASHAKRDYATMTELSSQLGLSVSNLESLIKVLREHQLVDSSKGPGGGYRLNCSASHTSIWDVVKVFDAPEGTLCRLQDLKPHESYIEGLVDVVMQILQNSLLSDSANTHLSPHETAAVSSGRFNFKPLPAPFIPKVPNSVFQLHMAL